MIRTAKTIAAFSLACLLASIGTTAASATAALPGEPLYDLKTRVNEAIAQPFLRGPQAMGEYELHRAMSRFDEAQRLSVSGRLTAELQTALEADFRMHWAKAKDDADTLKKNGDITGANGLLAEMSSFLEEHGTDGYYLQDLKGPVPVVIGTTQTGHTIVSDYRHYGHIVNMGALHFDFGSQPHVATAPEPTPPSRITPEDAKPTPSERATIPEAPNLATITKDATIGTSLTADGQLYDARL